MSIQWWTYVAIVAAAFAGGLLLNYALKKFNEARIDQRFSSLRRKHLPAQATQVQSPLIEIETKTPKPLENIIAKSNATGRRISLVFNKEDNMLESKRAKEDLIKNSSLATAHKSSSICVAIDKIQSQKSIDINTTELETVDSKIVGNSESNIFFLEPTPMRVQSVSENPTFLGNIYKNDNLSRSRSNVQAKEKRKEEKLVLGKSVETVVSIKEIKSSPSIIGRLEVQNDMKKWISDIVYREIQSNGDLMPNTSETSFDK